MKEQEELDVKDLQIEKDLLPL